MRVRVPRTLIAAAWILAAAATSVSAREAVEDAGAAASAPAAVLSVRAGDPARQHALTNGAAWRSFRARYGGWQVLWNEATGTPHRAFGPSIPLAGFAGDAASADRAVRAFVAAHPELFGGSGIELQTAYVGRHGDVWYVRYRQTVQGVPVLFSDWEFRVGTNGRLMLFGADARAVPSGLDASPRLGAAVVREAAKAGIAFDPATDRVTGGDARFLLPVTGADGRPTLRLVTAATVQTTKPRYDSELTYVDSHTGDVVWRVRQRADAITGVVTGPVHLTTPTDPYVTKPMRNEWVNAVNGATTVTATTDSTTGFYSVVPSASPTTITSGLFGPYCQVVRNDNAPSASFSQSTNNNSVRNIAWVAGNSKDSERDAFYHVNLAHDWVKGFDPAYTANDYPLLTNVNINTDECEAYWDQPSNSLNFFLDGPTCPNTASMPDIVWHEYCHSISYNLYFANGAPNGLVNATLAEGLADAFAALLGDEPLIGNGYFGPGTFLRDVRIPLRYPDDLTSSAHASGDILAGALWDLRGTAGNAVASRDMHFAKYGLPDDPDAGVAMGEFFLDMLTADDDNGDLSDGTPHLTQIVNAFNAHGIGTDYFIGIDHTPLADQPTSGPFPISALISYSAPIGSLGQATMYYSVNNSPWVTAPMLPTGNPDEYEADIPNESYGVVKYYIQCSDSYGGVRTLPAGAPNKDVYQFIGGPATTLIYDDMETDPGWTVGFPGDAAVTGIWVRAVPNGTAAQTGTNHTPSGTQCWVTGNTPDNGNPGTDDVDGGKTTLVTNTFSAVTGGMVHPIVTYWRYYSNNVGDYPNEDPWRTFISNNNGSTWAMVENTSIGNGGWKRISFNISQYVTPTSTMKMRFVAQDTLNPSLVEAALDDWYLVAYSATLAVPEPAHPAEFAATTAPNPFQSSTHVRFTLPAAGPVSVDVYDLEGRKVVALVNGTRPAGTQSVDWDGRDSGGRLAPSGPYYIRLTRADRVINRAVILRR